jgi:Kef-type K+ transport system membrane component KefB
MIFAPLFLAAQGTHFTATSLTEPAFAISLVAIAIASKMIGGYWGARIQGLSRHEAQGTAIVMNARGVMEMVVASIAYRAGLVDQTLFSTLLIVGIVTTMLTPLLLKRWQKQQAPYANPGDESSGLNRVPLQRAAGRCSNNCLPSQPERR